jgi:hypothetical protein
MPRLAKQPMKGHRSMVGSHASTTATALDGRARRAARRAGLAAIKSRRQLSSANRGGYMLVNPERNFLIAGEHFELSAEAVIEFCQTDGADHG